MKRTFAAILCLILACLMLVSCGEDTIGDYINQYEEPKVKERLKLNLYVIYEEGTTKNALDTVQQRIESYTLSEYETAVKVIYCTASEYEARLLSAVKDGAAHKADIVLVNSKSLMDKLMAGNYLADITDYFNGKDYGTLNDKIAGALIDAVKCEGTVMNDLGEEVLKDDRMYYVPNNRVVGTYEYIIINREIARNYYISDNDLKTITSEEDASDLKALIEADGLDASEYIKVVKGMYEDKAAYEASGYACNIVSYPTVTVEDAYEGGFAVVKTTKDVNRAMEIIYALSTDVTLHNYLTYGIPQTNYSTDDDGNVTRNSEGNSVYYMNPLYTGDVFASYYCEELGWNEEAKNNGDIQNDAAYFYVETEDGTVDDSTEE
jgi:hypothetical protein